MSAGHNKSLQDWSKDVDKKAVEDALESATKHYPKSKERLQAHDSFTCTRENCPACWQESAIEGIW